MPVSVSKLEEESRPLSERISEFLAKNPANAYLESEVFGELKGMGNYVALYLLMSGPAAALEIQPYKNALEQLVEKGLVRRYERAGTAYYASASSA
jgi:hypothetical protein